MKILLFVFTFTTLFIFNAFAGEKAPPEVYDIANSKIKALGNNASFIKALKEHPERSAAEIDLMQEEWENTEGEKGIALPVLEHWCTAEMQKINDEIDEIEEFLLVDSKGCSVASLEREEEYDWSDEPGFKEAIAGNVYLSDVTFDVSDEEYLAHIWVPVVDDGKILGALDIGWELDE